MEERIKSFHELSTDELFEIYKLRVSVFVVEQTYAAPMYEKLGFEKCSQEYLEDGIPHVSMILE